MVRSNWAADHKLVCEANDACDSGSPASSSLRHDWHTHCHVARSFSCFSCFSWFLSSCQPVGSATSGNRRDYRLTVAFPSPPQRDRVRQMNGSPQRVLPQETATPPPRSGEWHAGDADERHERKNGMTSEPFQSARETLLQPRDRSLIPDPSSDTSSFQMPKMSYDNS